ncbi:hypothetical protein JCM10213_007046 [Rhodosporidiobolus nylandii]
MDIDILTAWTTASTSLSSPPSVVAAAKRTFATFLDPFTATDLEERKTREVEEAYQVLSRERGGLEDALEDYLDTLRASFPLLTHEIHTSLSAFSAEDDDSRKFDIVLSLLQRIGEWIHRWQAPVQAVWATPTALTHLRSTLLTHLHHSLPPSFAPALSHFLRQLLRLPSPSSLSFSTATTSSSQPHPPIPTLALPTLLTLLDRFDPLLFSLIYEEIEARVRAECEGKWGERKLEGLVGWLNGAAPAFPSSSSGNKGKERAREGAGMGTAAGTEGGVLGWISAIYDVDSGASFSGGAGGGEGKERGKKESGGKDEAGGGGAKKFLKPTFSRFEYHIHKTLAALRTTEMYDMILAFPASMPALEDLRLCLLKSPSRPALLSSLSRSLRTRLLHPGTDTREVLRVYILLVRALRVVDPSGVLMARAAGEVRGYLRARKDTIPHIVSSLVSPPPSSSSPSSTSSSHFSLAEELRATTNPDLAKGRMVLADGKEGDEAENYADPKWTPEPVEAPSDYRRSRSADIIQLLVSIYDTKDVFVKELQVLLAQRLLAIRDYRLEGEIATLQTLKLRFGEPALQGCDVMVKDLQDSQRMDEKVHSTTGADGHGSDGGLGNLPLHATIVSRLFWPSFQRQELKLPGQLGRAQQSYSLAYSRVSTHKKLRWLPQLGSVNLTVELADGRSVTTDATPVQAAVLELFDKQDTWSTSALASTLRLPDPSLARNALYFWSNLSVLRSLPSSEANGETDLWRLIEHASAVGAGEGEAEVVQQHVVEEEKQAVQSVEEKRVEEMRVFWQFIQGMLTNLGALPLSRIHSTLNMLAPGYKGKTTDELVALLEACAADGLVTKTQKGEWKMVK